MPSRCFPKLSPSPVHLSPMALSLPRRSFPQLVDRLFEEIMRAMDVPHKREPQR